MKKIITYCVVLAMIFSTFPVTSYATGTPDFSAFTSIPTENPWDFNYPGGVAVDGSGNVYVADSLNHCIKKFDSNGSLLKKWGSQGSGDGQLYNVSGIAVDASGNVYVSDYINNRIQKFNPDGSFAAKWTGFINPMGIAVDRQGNIYVAEPSLHRIQKIDLNGTSRQIGNYGTGDGQFNGPCAIAVDVSGNIYVADSGNNRIQTFDSTGKYASELGTDGSGDGQFLLPKGIAIDSAGNIYVADASNNRIQKFNSDGSFAAKWGSNGSDNGMFKNPSGIAVDGTGNVYVADYGNDRIQKFDSGGSFKATWAKTMLGNGQLKSPYGVTADSVGNVYVADTANHRIQKFDSDGSFVSKWGSDGSPGSANSQFNGPYAIAVDASNYVYVADTGNHRIQKFDSTGNFVSTWGSQGIGNGQFNFPYGIAVDRAGNVYVADTINNRIQKFDSNGAFLTQWGSGGSGDGQFAKPCGIAVDSAGNVYVADTDNGRIQYFYSNGDFVSKWGSNGSGDGQLNMPMGVSVDSAGNVYVADSGNHRIQKFNSNGDFVAKWGKNGGTGSGDSDGSGDGEFASPGGIAVDSSGNVYVADTMNNRIQKRLSTSKTVTFSKNGGDTDADPAAITVVSGGSVGTLPTAPVKAGYVFSGWNTAANGSGTAFTAGTAVSADLVVYAQWTEEYTVTFDKNGGDTEAAPAAVSAVSGGNVGTLPVAPTKAGYVFSGWNTAVNGSGTAFTAGTAVSADLVVYAQWTAQYTVTFDKNGGDTEAVPAAIAVVSGGKVGTLPAASTRSGYAFSGWNTAANGSGTAFTAETVVSTDLVVYAQWTVISNGGGVPTPSVPPATISETPTSVTSTTKIEAKLDANEKAAASITESQLIAAVNLAAEAAAKKGGDTQAIVEIKVTAPADAKSVEIGIPKAAFAALANGKADKLKASTPMATLTFDGDALSGISKEATDQVKITAAKVGSASLPEAAKQAIGDRPVFHFSVTSGDKTISQFGGTVTVEIPYTPAVGEDTNAIVIYYVNSNGGIETVTSGRYSAATGTVVFTTTHFSVYAVGYHKVSFTDVADTAWYSDAVTFLGARGITTGTAAAVFSPDATLTRGQFITLLLRAYGVKADADLTGNFSDAGNTYYTGYLKAAKELGISNGTGDNNFAPEKAITRQEMFTLLYNTLKVLDRLPGGASGKTLDDFSDADSVASWAKDAATHLAEAGAISGSEGKLNPTASAIRAEMAQMLYKLLIK